MKRVLRYLSISAALGALLLTNNDAFAQLPVASHLAPALETMPPHPVSNASVVLYDQTSDPGTNGAPSQVFPDFDGSVLESAEDFEVPVGETWDIGSVTALGSYSTTGGWTDWAIEFYEADGSGLPGAMVFQELGITDVFDAEGNVEVFLTAPTQLSEGAYFVLVRVTMDFSNEGQWFWTTTAGPIGLERVFQDPDDLLGTGLCPTWMPGATVCGTGDGVELDLSFSINGEIATANEIVSELPTAVTLGQSYPNPFNPNATIPFDVSETSAVRIAVFDVLGREVTLVTNQTYTPGGYSVSFEAANLPSGTYVYRLEANGVVQTRTITLLR